MFVIVLLVWETLAVLFSPHFWSSTTPAGRSYNAAAAAAEHTHTHTQTHTHTHTDIL